MNHKVIALAVVVWALGVCVYGQSVTRHPGDVLHYQIKFDGGDVGKITGVSIHLVTHDVIPADQPNAATQFGGNCGAPISPGVFECSVPIPDGIPNGTYQLFKVSTETPQFGTSYHQDFKVPSIPVQNPKTFNKPTSVTVTEKP